jgi:hypothetical protein
MGALEGAVALAEGQLAALHTLEGALARLDRLMGQVDASWPLEAALAENFAAARGAAAETRALTIALRDALRRAGGGQELQESAAARRLRLVKKGNADAG